MSGTIIVIRNTNKDAILAVKMDKKRTWKERKHDFRGARWVAVLHGQRESDYSKLVEFFDSDDTKCAVIAKEFGKHRIHPHWQIYFELKEPVYNVRVLLSSILGHSETHLEKARGTHRECVRYVYAVDKPHELGFVVYARNVDVPSDYRPHFLNFWRDWKPRPFQAEILSMLAKTPDRREIHWIYDTVGNSGKTILMEYLVHFHGAIVTGTRGTDMKHAIARYREITNHEPVIVCLSLARSAIFTRQTAQTVEEIKDGIFFSGKYDSAQYAALNKPHMFIFANEGPAKYKQFFSSDRWRIKFIDKNFELVHKS